MKSTMVRLAATAAGLLLPLTAASAQKTDWRSKLDPQMTTVIEKLESLGGKPIHTLSAEDARKQPTPADAVKEVLKDLGKSTDPEAVGKVEDRMVPGAQGQVPIRIYWPKGDGPFPVVHYIHGGGWVIADLDVYDSSPRALANAANAIVVSTHYRQAPEHKFPASHLDVYATYLWTVKNAKSLGGDPRLIAVAGESAGGNMAAYIAKRATREGDQKPVHQLLVYPVASDDMTTESYQENANAMPLDKAGMEWFAEKTFASKEDLKDPRFNLLEDAKAGDLPAATIITAEIDPLRSDGAALADKLQKAGNDTAYRGFEGVTHEFFGMGAAVDKAKEAVKFSAGRLKRSFENPRAASR